MNQAVYDICIIGGGINGTGIARDAAGRGFSVLLVERGDLGEGMSSRSSKLVHGDLRDLERRRFRLVRQALEERDTLLAIAPHIVRPLRLVLPHDPEFGRPWWMLGLGLDLYESLHKSKRRRLPARSRLDLTKEAEGRPLKPGFRRGFAYSDCRVDDARLVILNAVAAAGLGAAIMPRTACTAARRAEGLWRVTLKNSLTEATRDVKARALVNAAGPWADRVLAEALDRTARPRRPLVRSSHILVPALYEGDQAYVLQQPERGLVHVTPFEGQFSLVGAVEVAHDGEPDDPHPSPDEIGSLCAAVSRAFRREVTADDVRYAFAGIRPLIEGREGKAADHVIEVEGEREEAPLLTVFGGRITTYRRLAEAVLDKLKTWFPNLRPSWTATAPLPGGDMPEADFARFLRGFRRRRPWLPPHMSLRLARAYGTQADALLEGARSLDDLGRSFGAGLTEREVHWQIEHEWAMSAEDILWRRTRLGFHMTAEERRTLTTWMLRTALPEPA